MKYEVFNETHQQDPNALITDLESMQVSYPFCMRGIMRYIKEHFLGISLLRIGLNGIELATNPNKIYENYLEYSMYANNTDYSARKQKYLKYLMENAAVPAIATSARTTLCSLKNFQTAWLYSNDNDRILVWVMGRKDPLFAPYTYIQKAPFFNPYPDEEAELIALIEGTFEDEIVQDPETNLPLTQSRNLPLRPPASSVEPGNLRFDGLYTFSEGNSTIYLRFFPSGQVSGVTSTGTPEGVFRWLDTEFDTSGAYTLQDNKIYLSIRQEDIIIGEEFWGEVQLDALSLQWKLKKSRRKVYSGTFTFHEIHNT